MTAPDFLPSLSAGAHDAGDGEACVMEYVSLLAGEEWSDRPECTHELLAHEARTVNDLLRDGDRPRLVPLVGRLFGTTEDSSDLRAHLRLEQVRQVLVLLEPSSRAPVAAAADHARSWLGHGPDDAAVAEALAPAARTVLPTGDLDAEHTAYHVASSRLLAFAHWPEVEPAEAHALVALSTAHVVAASGECRADCGNGPARGRRMVGQLAALVDVYDRVTGRQATDATPEQVRELAEALR